MMRDLSPSRHKDSSRTSPSCSSGFSLVEIILAGAMLLIIAGVFVGSAITGVEQSMLSGNRAQAAFLAEQGLEAVRSIRDESFANLVDGTWGLSTSSGKWSLFGSSSTVDIFDHSIVISSPSGDTKKVESHISWQQNLQRTASTTAATYLTDWSQNTQSQADSTTVNTASVTLSGDNKELRNIELSSDQDTVIASITVSWNNSKKIERIRMGGTTVWSKSGPGSPEGTQGSGTLLDIDDHELEGTEDEGEEVDIKFTGKMEGVSFTITLTFVDESQKTFTVF